jgi:NAD(P)-dependent dehydrogenase (short-subunit alcohol dehydrogenase family)
MTYAGVRVSRLNGKVAIITGGAGGIGLACGVLFAEEGAKILLVDIDEDGLKKAVERNGNDRMSYLVADVSREADVEHYVQVAVERYGGIDIFINNAGIEGVVREIVDYPTEVFDRVIAVNLRGAWLGLKYVIAEMQKRGGGSIIITSSVGGIRGSAGACAYVASKHALVGLARTAALEYAARGIRVNSVNPGPTDTRMMYSLAKGHAPEEEEQETRRSIMRHIPMNRYCTPQEVAQLMLFLASDESRFCTGGVYVIDGGISAR